MELFSITWSTWDNGALDIDTYFGYVSLPLRTIIAIVLITIGVKIYKRIKSRKVVVQDTAWVADETPKSKDIWAD